MISNSKEAIHRYPKQGSYSHRGPGWKTTVNNGMISVYAQLHQLDLRKKQAPKLILGCSNGTAARRMNELTGLRAPPFTAIWDDRMMTSQFRGTIFWTQTLSLWTNFPWLSHHWSINYLAILQQIRNPLDCGRCRPSLPSALVRSWLISADPKHPLRPNSKHIFRQRYWHCLTGRETFKLSSRFHRTKADRSYFEAGSEHIPKMIEQINFCCPSQSNPCSRYPGLGTHVQGPGWHWQYQYAHARPSIQLSKIRWFWHARLLIPRWRQGHPSGQWCRAMSLMEILATSPIFSQENIQNLLRWIDHPIWWQWNRLSGRNEWYKIRLAYAMSIHKSQGSEFPVVIYLLPIKATGCCSVIWSTRHHALLRVLILLGEYSALITEAVHEKRTKTRCA